MGGASGLSLSLQEGSVRRQRSVRVNSHPVEWAAQSNIWASYPWALRRRESSLDQLKIHRDKWQTREAETLRRRIVSVLACWQSGRGEPWTGGATPLHFPIWRCKHPSPAYSTPQPGMISEQRFTPVAQTGAPGVWLKWNPRGHRQCMQSWGHK